MEVVPKVWIGGLYATTPLKHRDNSSPTWKSALSDAGVELTEAIDIAEIILIIDIKESEMKRIRQKRSSNTKWILIRHEPLEVLPANYHSHFLSLFDLVIDCGIDPSKSRNSILRPQFWPSNENDNAIKRDHKRFVLVNSNQLGLMRGELYSLRRHCIYELPQVDLYGHDWNIGYWKKVIEMGFRIVQLLKYRRLPNISSARYWFRHPKNKIASPIEKLDVMSRYKTALVIENSLNFMTEKIFDALFSGCIPIYVGPPVENFGIPAHLYIQALPNIKDIERCMNLAKKIDYSTWRTQAAEWINDESTKRKWSLESSAKQVRRHLDSISNNTNEKFDG